MNWQSASAASAAKPGAASDAAGDLTMTDVCARTGLSARTVRYYEELGLLPGVRRRAGARRVYGGDELERLRFIQRLQLLGLPLAEIRELNDVHAIGGSTGDMLGRLDELLATRLAELDGRIAELTGLRAEIETYRARVARRAAALRRKKGRT